MTGASVFSPAVNVDIVPDTKAFLRDLVAKCTASPERPVAEVAYLALLPNLRLSRLSKATLQKALEEVSRMTKEIRSELDRR